MQRPEIGRSYNTLARAGANIRVFPLSNWTERDVWRYIRREHIDVVPLYFAMLRPVVSRDGALIMVDDHRLRLHEKEVIEHRRIRFRTLGCYPLTGAVDSTATDVDGILAELASAGATERAGRLIDGHAGDSMEAKKREGYF
jgi:sulfate adenylyltransferase subunit 2